MQYKTYILSSRLSAETTIARLGDLLGKAGVQYRTESPSVVSTHTPTVLFSLQRAMYSNRNWVGVNPFPFISGVSLRCQPGKRGLTEVIVQVNRVRTFLWAGFWVWGSGLAALRMPEPEGAIFFIVIGLAAWLGFIAFLSGYLVKKEITNCLKA